MTSETPTTSLNIPIADLTQEELLALRDNLHLYPKHKQIQILEILDVLTERKKAKRCRENLLDFIIFIDPDYKIGKHHRKLATLLENMAYGRKDRVMVNIAPRFGKSMLTSIYFPAWYIGNFPKKNIMMVSHTSDLAVDFGRKVRNIVDSPAYKEVFPDVSLAADSKSAGRWSTNQDGSYFAVGVGGAIAGRGADLLCVSLNSKVISKERGEVRADSIKLGEHLWGFGGFNKVEKIFHSESTEEIEIDGAVMTPNHPVWTFDRGWVPAEEVCEGDVVDVVSAWDVARIRSGVTTRRATDVAYEDNLGGAPRRTKQFSWLRRTACKIASRRSLFGSVFGVKKVAKTERRCGPSTRYVNFQVSDSNTFYVDGLMTHNCIDDPHNEQEILNGNYEIFERAYDWYAFGARTRLSPTGVVALVMTRWSTNDLTGKLVQDMARNPESDQWEVVEFPAILDVQAEILDERGMPTGDTKLIQKSLWPEQWPVESLLRTKASMPPFQWSAQYMQQPTSKDSAIVKREWWQKWEEEDPPTCEYIIMALDAAAEKNNRADFTSLSTWGVFYKDNEEGVRIANIILLNAIKARWEFPELKRRAYEEYKQWAPDWFLVEKKSAGVAIYQEMRSAGIPVQEVTPTARTGDKVVRLNSVCDIFSAGLVWYPAGRRWAEEMVDEVCGFPVMQHDDQVDTCVYSLMRFRSGGFISLPTDRREEDHEFIPRRANYY